MKTISNKLLVRIIISFLLIASISFLIFNENGILKFLKMKSEMNQLNDQISKAEDRLKAINAEIDSLKTSKEKIERVAREKFDMMKKNEKVFKIEEK
ncbi:hypothetical protein C0389_09580 [bacterium]|nr:hypothetical protein [bacterium]